MCKLGILYICTGKYDIFWEDFYKSCSMATRFYQTQAIEWSVTCQRK